MDQDPVDPQVASWIGPYRLLTTLGEGGMGTVYLAEQTQPVRRRVALKVIKPGMDSKAVLARFDAERRALAMMDHPNIARVLDAGCDASGRPFFVMELVRGEPITTYCDKNRCALATRLRLFMEVCNGIQHAHHKGVVHRDIKPNNVLVETPGSTAVARIIDFGLARATNHVALQQSAFTEFGQLIGTPEYMSPEQAEMTGADIDTRTDVYSLGVLLYELVAGILPFPKTEARELGLLELQRRIREVDPPPPSRRICAISETALAEVAEYRGQSPRGLVRALRDDLDWIVMRCIEKDRTRRYPTVSELAADIARHLSGQPVLARPPSTGYKLRKFVRNHRVGLGISSLFVALALTAFVVVAQQRRRAENAVAELQDALTDLGQDFDLTLASRLIDRVWRLSPITFETASEAQSWLDEADQLMHSVVAGHQPVPHAKRDAEMQRVQSALSELLAQLQRDPGWHPRIRDSIASVRRTESDLSTNFVAQWQRAREDVAADSRFAGFELHAQRGLVPLGPDPDTHLNEFAVALTGTIPKRDSSGGLDVQDGTAIVLVLLPGGTCEIGAAEGDRLAFPNESPRATLVLEPFFLSKYELTVQQWLTMTGALTNDVAQPPTPPNKFWRGTAPEGDVGPRSPVEMISWEEVGAALLRYGLVLPSEAQWEYAARAGTSSPWWTGTDRESLRFDGPAENIADAASDRSMMALAGAREWDQYDDGFPVHTLVGSLRPNPFGLHDMLGNLREWCADTWVMQRSASQFRERDGMLAVPYGETKAVRGGSWFSGVRDARASARRGIDKRHHFDSVGARAARMPDVRR